MLQTLNANKRILLALLITIVIGLNFWIGSRYPNLNEKAYMSGEMQLDALGFDVVIEVAKDDPLYFKIAATTVNWVKTNKQGMIFGIMMAAGIMTLLSLFKRRSFTGSFANTAMGAIVGTPLGVCVNCAAPIARGMHSAGARIETTLAMMLSSPTMNVIVLTMLFSLFPWYMAVTKIVVTLAFILVGIPLLARYVFKNEVIATTNSAQLAKQTDNPFQWSMYEEDAPGEGESWFASIWWVGLTYLKHLWFIVKTTVPLMLLAGLLGAVAISIMPWNSLSALMPQGALLVMLGFMFLIAIIGIFLPCPITFDVIAASVLLSAGMPVPYVMALLFTLGIYSVYSFSIVWTAISKKVAVVLTAGLVVMGVISGFVADFGAKHEKQKLNDLAISVLQGAEPIELLPKPFTETPADQLLAGLAESRLPHERQAVEALPGIQVDRIAWNKPGETSGPGFVKHDGSEFGIIAQTGFSPVRVIIPANMGRGIAAGDVHNDGWQDILLAEDRTVGGVTLYANRGGQRFEPQKIDIPVLADKTIIVAALVDINSDGWLDIFLSAHMEGNYIIFNKRGEFLKENIISLPNPDGGTTFSASFGDVDADGDLDAVLGNWAMGGFRRVNAASRNILLVNENNQFRGVFLKEMVGETLSTLFSDFNNDGVTDLFVGNDFISPDYFYIGTGNGNLKQVTRADGIIPQTTTTTMTVHVADIDNDLVPEMYIGEISRGVGVKFFEHMRDSDIVCAPITDAAARSACEADIADYDAVAGSMKRRDVSLCLGLNNRQGAPECVGINVLWSMVEAERQIGPIDPRQCSVIPEHMKMFQYMCNELSKPKVKTPKQVFDQSIPQIKDHNVLLVANGNGGFEDEAIKRGLELGGWSWNAKFADLDNDGWKDIYIANGFFQSDRRESNIFYLNKQDGHFTDKTIDFGLEDFSVVVSHTYVDFDNDGDLDVISVPVYGNVRVFENKDNGNNAIAFELRDGKGNRFGIGSKVVIRYGGDKPQQQVWEIQSGGGFLTFDPYIAHFGLGQHKAVENVEIQWSTGEKTTVKGPFEAGARYVVTRDPGTS